MMPDRFCLPLLIDQDGKGDAYLPERSPLGSPPFTESELQTLLEKHPAMLPVGLIDPIFGPPVCIGREVSTGSGPLDNLYVSPKGYLTIVETKLWKNPEARRKVVGQIIDYTKQLVKWDYTKLEEAFREYAKRAGVQEMKLCDYVSEQTDEEIDEAGFIDAVERCLRAGRFLLLIVGDGIREGLEAMASYLQETPSIQFTLALVEVGCYRIAVDTKSLLLLVPRIVARTAEIERAIVRIEMSEEASHKVVASTAIPEEPNGKRATQLSKKEFYDLLGKSVGDEHAREIRGFVDALLHRHVLLHEHFTTRRLSIKLELPETDENPRTIFCFRHTGEVHTSQQLLTCLSRNGYPTQIGEDFFARLGAIDPLLAPERKPDGKLTIKKSSYRSLDSILSHLDELGEALVELALATEEASEEIEVK